MPDKGKVEGLVGSVRLNFMTPLPVADSFDALNVRFLDACTKRRQAILRGHSTTIADRMQPELAAFMPLPAAPYDACHKVANRVSSPVSPWRWCATTDPRAYLDLIGRSASLATGARL